MQFSTLALAALSSVLSAAQGVRVHIVEVGRNSRTNETANKFFPETIVAQTGDMVQFHFRAGNHTVTQSNFDNPCVPISTVVTGSVGIWSGFQPVAASQSMGRIPIFTVMINDTQPLWMFCSQGSHCQRGMSLVINENTQGNATRSLTEYKRLSVNAAQGNVEIPNNGVSGGNPGSTPVNGDGSVSLPGTVTGAASVGAEASMTTLLLLLGAACMLL